MKHKIVKSLILTMALVVSSAIPVAAEEESQVLNSEEVQKMPEGTDGEEVQEMPEAAGDKEVSEVQQSDPEVPQTDTEIPLENTEQSGSWILNSTGWWFAYEDGTWPSNGIYKINGMNYAFDAAGYMITGWYQNQEGWYYFSGSGEMMTGWQLVNGAWYYLDGENVEHPGLMVSGCKKGIGGQTYFFQGSGAMYTGWGTKCRKAGIIQMEAEQC